MERSLRHAGLDLSADEVLPVYIECYAERLLDTTRLYPGIAEALDALARHALAVLTNKPGDFSRRILEGLGVAPRFARVLGAGDVPSRKPDPSGLFRLMAEAQAAPGKPGWSATPRPTSPWRGPPECGSRASPGASTPWRCGRPGRTACSTGRSTSPPSGAA